MKCLPLESIALIIGLIGLLVAVLSHPSVIKHLESIRFKATIKVKGMNINLFVFMIVWTMTGLLGWGLYCAFGEKKAPRLEPSTSPSTPSIEPVPTPARVISPLPTSTPEITPTRKIPGVPVERHDGELIDEKGQRAKYQLYVFTREYNWQKGKNHVQLNREPVPDTKMIDYLSKIHGDMKSADVLICVGAASYDMENDENIENDRANQRSNALVTWTRRSLAESNLSPRIFSLSLGHYRSGPDEDSQRLIMIIGVTKVDKSVNIDNIMSNGVPSMLKKKLRSKDFPFSLDNYSKFDLIERS